MSSNPCQICGSTDLNLIDGYYYCVECGTQDVNIRETVVEQTMLADGTFAILTKKKFSTVLKDAVEMSGEWHKWHAYNFMLVGLTEELIRLGAKPSVKTVILWIWTRYIKKFQNKAEAETTQFEKVRTNEEDKSKDIDVEDGSDSEEISEMNNKSDENIEEPESPKKKKVQFRRDIKIITKGTLLTILYVALNLDRSDIQLTHLLRFIREGRLSIYNCLKFIPKELCVKSIPYWVNFIRCQNEYSPRVIRAYAMTIFKRLNLGTPLLPDLNKIICNYVKELCLPEDFKHLTLALINLIPCDILQLNIISMKKLVRVPDYEGVCISYILVALKMCFGLDCTYELKLSDYIDMINIDQDYLKYYKLGMYCKPTDRLFSFREWYTFLQFRKMILCKYYLPMSRQYNLPADDCVFMEHLEERKKRKTKLSDDVTMDILKKIPLDDIIVIPKTEFQPTLTPMTLYTEVILKYIKDPDLKLSLSEDFSQYSLKYATQDLKLPEDFNHDKKLIKGVDKKNKIVNRHIIGTLKSKKGDPTMVLVRNCENRNWLTTKPPTAEHVTKIDKNKNSSDKDSDYGYDSNIEIETPWENKQTEALITKEHPEEKNGCEVIVEEDGDISIFDDDFKDLQIVDDDKKDATPYDAPNTTLELHQETSSNFYDSKLDIHDSSSEVLPTSAETCFDPQSFDKNKIIQELIEITCKKYKISFPKERETTCRRPCTKKRKNTPDNEQSRLNGSKRKKIDQKNEKPVGVVNQLIRAYYENLQSDIFTKISEQVRSAIEIAENQTYHNNYKFMDDTPHIEHQENDLHNQSSHICTNDNDRPFPGDNIQIDTLNDTSDDNSCYETLFPKNDPKFDDKTYDIEQLYVKLNAEQNPNIIDNIDPDPDVIKIIDQEIEEFRNGSKNVTNISDCEGQITEKMNKNISDNSDDDIPLSELLYEKMSSAKKNNRSKYEKLLRNTEVKRFGYWMKHYKSRSFARNLVIIEKFNIELVENCPISFVFVLRECAAISNCTEFSLYKNMQALEIRLLNYRKQKKKQ